LDCFPSFHFAQLTSSIDPIFQDAAPERQAMIETALGELAAAIAQGNEAEAYSIRGRDSQIANSTKRSKSQPPFSKTGAQPLPIETDKLQVSPVLSTSVFSDNLHLEHYPSA
jgi:hypothetical protein